MKRVPCWYFVVLAQWRRVFGVAARAVGHTVGLLPAWRSRAQYLAGMLVLGLARPIRRHHENPNSRSVCGGLRRSRDSGGAAGELPALCACPSGHVSRDRRSPGEPELLRDATLRCQTPRAPSARGQNMIAVLSQAQHFSAGDLRDGETLLPEPGTSLAGVRGGLEGDGVYARVDAEVG
jgi:hypothetical protein